MQDYVSIRKSFIKQKVLRFKDLVVFYIGPKNFYKETEEHVDLCGSRVVAAGNCRDDFDARKISPIKKSWYLERKIEAKEGDILLNTLSMSTSTVKQYVFVVEGPLENKLYLGEGVLAMRLKTNLVTKEYLYLYFRSDIVKKTIALFGNQDERKTMYKDLADIPIILPKSDIPMGKDEKAIQTYKKLFKALYGTETEKDEIDRYALLHGAGSRKELDDILREEYNEKIKALQNDDVSYYIKENKKEMTITKKNNAHKATIVLAGAILETFLIDWASAIDGKDYFKDPFNRRGEEMRLNEAISYLAKRIFDKSKKKWGEKLLAENIMKLRNNIHPAVYMRHKENINSVDCDNVCQWLDEIIKSRGDFNF